MHNFPLEDFSWFIGNNKDILKKIKKVSSSPLTFKTEGATYPESYTLIPFNRIHFSRYVMYFPYSHTTKDVVDRIEKKKELDKVIKN